MQTRVLKHLRHAHLCLLLVLMKFELKELKFQISQRSELSLRRYFQTNIDFLKTLIFNLFNTLTEVFKEEKLLTDYGIFSEIIHQNAIDSEKI